MSSVNNSHQLVAYCAPDPLDALFMPPPGLNADEQRSFSDMQQHVADVVGPKDFLERHWAYEISVAIWECQRWRSRRESILRNGWHEAMAHLLVGRIEGAHALSLLARRGDPDAIAALAAAMAKHTLTDADVHAQALILNSEEIDRIERLIERANAKEPSRS